MTGTTETIRLGLDRFIADPPADIHNQRLGLLCNTASVGRDLIHSRVQIRNCFKDALKVLFSPQHGLFAEKQDNMIESAHRRDHLLDLPVYSLYSATRIPTREMFDAIDVLVVDLQDVGTRVYTFIYTISHCMEAARKYGKKILILDRPNPIGGLLVEGNCLDVNWRSFVGRFPIPMRHGLTVGELALLFNGPYGIGCELEVVPMQGWRRSMLYNDTGLPWVAPSPNLPTAASSLVYPGQVILEGTNLSEGRGTTQPFEFFGAPFLNTRAILDYLDRFPLAGVILRPMEFEPTANKWQGHRCHGFQIHVTDPLAYRPYRSSLVLLQAVIYNHGDQFKWKMPPYEYDYERMPIDLILGNGNMRSQIEAMVPVTELEAAWQNDLDGFEKLRSTVFLYP